MNNKASGNGNNLATELLAGMVRAALKGLESAIKKAKNKERKDDEK